MWNMFEAFRLFCTPDTHNILQHYYHLLLCTRSILWELCAEFCKYLICVRFYFFLSCVFFLHIWQCIFCIISFYIFLDNFIMKCHRRTTRYNDWNHDSTYRRYIARCFYFNIISSITCCVVSSSFFVHLPLSHVYILSIRWNALSFHDRLYYLQSLSRSLDMSARMPYENRLEENFSIEYQEKNQIFFLLAR